MTREEAIKTLEGKAWSLFSEKWNEALDMAIKALEQEPTYVSELTQKAYEDGKKDGYIQAKIEQEPIIDKIRTEIITRDKNVKAIRSDSCCFFTAEEVLKIIDKYKESEVEDGNDD